jgi:hypothetical protein
MLQKKWRLCKKHLFFVISVKTEIQMFKIVRDSHFRGNDNAVIITFYKVSMPLVKGMIIKQVLHRGGLILIRNSAGGGQV